MVNQYPVPKAEDIFATLAVGKKFTKLDPSQNIVINTHQVPFPSTPIWDFTSTCTISESNVLHR